MMTWPKPVQKPHPPILVGAARRAIRYGDGWCPVGRTGSSLADVLEKYRQMARDAGRDPQTVPVTLFNPAEDQGELARHRDMGVARVVPMLLSEERDKILPILDRWATLAALRTELQRRSGTGQAPRTRQISSYRSADIRGTHWRR
jgi:alkanesulfonate monooxygenase SsuD/methylene tetrahydromethanopterin reductase-like flavin-dependent oxidoreductase (luciferase family)